LKGDLREHQEGAERRARGGVHAQGGEASNFKLHVDGPQRPGKKELKKEMGGGGGSSYGAGVTGRQEGGDVGEEREEEEEEEGECEECGVSAMGAIDQSNNAFYCNACWALFKVYTCSK
jgi:hypothetical protein